MAPAKLIKSNPKNKSEVWEFDNHFRKKWLYKDEPWLEKHYQMLKDTCGDVYVKNFGFTETEMWLDTNKLPGKLATTFDFTPEFIERISRFCLEQYKKTKPFAHFDWDLNNIIISDNNISLVDWDNYGMYSEGQVLDKMKADLKKSFGDKLIENIFFVDKEDYKEKNNASSEKLKFVLELYSEYWKNPPIVEIYINDVSKYKSMIKGTKDKPDIISFEHHFNEGEKWTLVIDRYNKTEKETNFVNGKILNDQLLHIKNINIDDIDIGSLVFKGLYTPNYPKRWAIQQKQAGIELPKTLKNVTIIGHNGRWVFEAESPFYMWLLENLY